MMTCYSLNQNRTEVYCDVGDIALGGGGNPAYCNGNEPSCGRTQYLEANRKITSGNREGWRSNWDVGGDEII